MNVKFNVFTKASNKCDPIVDGNDASSGGLRVIDTFRGSYTANTLAASNSWFDSLVRKTENVRTK